MKRSLPFAAAIVLVAASQLPAQFSEPVFVRLSSSLQEPDAATLPEIEVRPPAQDASPPSIDGSTAPGGDAAPPSPGTSQPLPFSDGGLGGAPSDLIDSQDAAGPTASNNGGSGRSGYGEAFPSLSERVIGGSLNDPTGLNSVLRGETSIFETPRLSTIVDRETLDRRQASTVQRALQNEVGVLLQQTGNGQLSPFVRGLTGQQVLILIDGVRMNTSILRPGPNQYAATIDPGSIERIEIIRGAQSAMWGSDAIGGAINFVTRSADPLRGDYFSPMLSQYYSTAEASSYTRTGFSTWSGQTGITGGVSYLDVGNLDRGGGLGRQPATDYQQYAGDVKFQRVIDDDHMLTVLLQHLEQEDLERSDRFLPFVLGPAPNGRVPTQRPTVFDPQQRNLIYARLEGLVAEDIFFADAYSATLSGMRTKEGSIVDRYSSNSPAALPTRREIGEFDDLGWGVALSAVKDGGEFGKLTYGADYYDESIDAVRTRIDNPTLAAAVARPADPQYPDDSQADRVGTFLVWDVPLTERLSATAATRYENIDVSATPNFETIGPVPFSRTYQDWVGSAGLSYLLTEQLRLIGGVYEGFRAPTIDDLTANKTSLQNVQSVPLIGNLAVQPEHAYTYEAGFKIDGERWRLQAVEFWTDFDSFLSREVIGGIDFLTNQTAYINGTELDGQYLLARDVALHGNFFYTYGELNDGEDFVSRIPPTQGIVGVRFDQPISRSYIDVFTWMVARADRYNETNLSDVRFIPGGTPGYATLNLRAGKAFGSDNRNLVSLSLENITDKYYRVLGSGVDGAGFNAIFGYQYSR